MERELAHIERIHDIKPIEGADNIDKAKVLGWDLIVKKGEFQEGDLCVFFEVDSKLPKADWSEFLEKRDYKVKIYKLGKFGVWSEGLALPISSIPQLKHIMLSEGDGVTELLGVVYSVQEDNIRKKGDPDAKYKSMSARNKKLFQKKPIRWLMKRTWGKKLLFFFFGRKKDSPKGFPDWIKKTDEQRCLYGGTNIETNIGKMRLAQIVNKKMDVLVKTIDSNNHICFKPIEAYQKFKPEPTLQIRQKKSICANPTNHSSGAANSIICSLDHKFLTENGYIEAEKLTCGDELLFPMRVYTDESVELLYGAMLGDGHMVSDIRQRQSKIHVTFTQGEKQIEYLKEKLRLLGEPIKVREGKSGYCDNKVYMAHTKVDEALSQALFEDEAVVNHKLFITKKYCKRLTPLSLAIWQLDDGSVRHGKENETGAISIEFSTHAYTEEEVDNLIERLKDFGLSPVKDTVKKHGVFIGYTIRLNKNDSMSFLELIKNYIPDSMKYKATRYFNKEEYSLANTVLGKEERLMPVEIISIEKHKPTILYDITVKDTHNFIANGVVSHNCENMPWVLGNGKVYDYLEKLDGSSSSYGLKRLKKGKNKYEFFVCSRNVRLNDPEQETYHEQTKQRQQQKYNIYWFNAFKYNIQEHLTKYMNAHPELDWVYIQGESVGSVQGNPYKLTEDDLYVFNFVTNTEGRWPSPKGKELIESWGMKWVPLLGTATIPADMEELKLFADGKSVINPKVDREGLVYRGLDGQESFKNVSRKYLLKHQQ